MFPLLVIDASAALALVLAEDQGKEVANLLESVLRQNGQLFVPELFWYEVCNGLVSAERQRRVNPGVAESVIAELGRMPIVCHSSADEGCLRATLELARMRELTIYDAAYLELAIRHKAKLKSYDSHLVSLRRHYPDVIL